LERLQVCHLHDPEHSTFQEITKPGGALDAMVKLKQESIIGVLGVAGGPIDMSIQYVELGVFDAVITHNRYTLLNRTAEPLLDVASKRGLAVFNAAPYGSGILAKGPDQYARYAYQAAAPEVVARARQMQTLCQEHGVSLAAAALQFSLRDPRITSTIVGMSKPERIQQTIDLALTPIPEALWPRLDAVGYEGSREGHLDPERHRWQA
jgi:D-threo-aldose 1-dehydrogenase